MTAYKVWRVVSQAILRLSSWCDMWGRVKGLESCGLPFSHMAVNQQFSAHGLCMMSCSCSFRSLSATNLRLNRQSGALNHLAVAADEEKSLSLPRSHHMILGCQDDLQILWQFKD